MHYYRGAKRCRWVSYLNSDETQAMSGGLKLPFLTSLSQNFSTLCLHRLSKFVDKSAQKLSIFSIKASFERRLISFF